jgi:1A family penicillin-binding protein
MKLLIFLINLIIIVLTTIGDFVLFYLSLILKTISWLIKKIFSIPSLIKKALVFEAKKVDTKSKLTAFRIFLSFKAFKRRLARKKASLYKHKQKQAKEIEQHAVSIYPTPRYFKIKIKFFIIGFLFCIIFLLIPLGIYAFLSSLPNPKQLSEREIPQTTKIYDRNGKLLYQIYANENRTLVPINSIPKDLINATIAIEDKDFYKNPGVDINAIARAAIADASGKSIQGGSTITQQLIKSTLLTPEVSIQRKVKEIVLAYWAEKIYTKNQILEMYFNQVPYGGTAWGIEAASETYFDKNVKDLDLAQCAFLAGMPQAPSTYSPYGENPNLWKQRQKDVLNKMYQLKYITKDQEENALNETLVFEPPQTPIYAPHFVMYVKDYLVKKYGLPLVEKGGLNVTTSLDLDTQNKIQDIVRQEIDNDQSLNLTNGAALVTNPSNGDILAMVGSRDYNDPNGGNVNLTTALRQPGSSIKIITYSAALSNGFTAATILDDSPVTYTSPGGPSYTPVNYDGAYHGKIPLRIAFANSFNIPAVKTLNKIGIPTMVNMADKMGITTWKSAENYGLSITLGAAEVKMTDMATVYSTVANLGKKVELDPLLKVTDYQGDIIYQKQKQLPRQVLDSGIAYIVSNILADNNARSLEFGPNSPLNISGHTVSVKTGTTDNKRDNWTIGYTPSYLAAVWVGNNDNSPMSPTLASGITGAAPIWNKIMSSLLPNVSDAPLKVPDDLITKTCFGRAELFIKGTENNPGCNSATPSATLTANKN